MSKAGESQQNKSTALLDGGSYHCAKHDKPFTTQNAAEWTQHILADNEKGEFHTHSGSAKCAYCGEMKEFKREPVTANYFCNDCKEKIVSQIQKQQQKSKETVKAKK